MKNQNKKYARSSLLKYKVVSSMVDEDFIKDSFFVINDIKEHSKTNLLTINDNYKKKNLSIYKRKYQNYINNSKNYLLKIGQSNIVKKCLKYNNKHLFNNLINFDSIHDLQKKNNFYRSLVSYLNRICFNPVYGGFMSFYSVVSFSDKFKKIKINLFAISEKNKLIKNNTKKIKSFFYTNPAILFHNDNEFTYFKYSDNNEEIVFVKNKLLASFLQDIVNKKNTLKSQTRKTLELFLKKNNDLKLISFKDDNIIKTCFKTKKDLSLQKLDKKLNIKDDYIYDLFNKNLFYVEEGCYTDFNKPASIYLYFLQEQLKEIHNEKKYLGKILRDYLVKNNKENCSLLEFIIKYNTKIIDLRKKRENFSVFFENKISLIIQDNKGKDEINLSSKKYFQKNKVRNNLEFYFSRCKLNNKNYYTIENISPQGVFSSRFDYVLSGSNKATYLNKINSYEPIEVIFKPADRDFFHIFRRKKYCKYSLNINNFIKYSDKDVININDINLTLDKNNLPILYSTKLDKYFDPVTHTTMSAEQSIVTIFLRMISRAQEEVYFLPKILPQKNNNLDFIPRITIDNLLLTKKMWVIKNDLINVIKGSMIKYNEFLYLIDLFNTKKIPRFVTVFTNRHNIRFFDLYNPVSLLLLKKYKEKFIYFEEMLPSPLNLSFFDEKQEFFTQYHFLNNDINQYE